ncbi:5'-nucleotidase/UDP-sugar diphosphatase [Kitasatospora sp. MAA4]|uniref:metallophosphoesterase n=1 Tax=Kitasatospora sp. MAA4 TaxID=3035093 RepID=UPI002473B511|nr:metallophosphoesterase [Kitasatospora sp. MAA4]MDH6136448.1 5'-nucleotidase/UDP-sugar diphosphatase [Kitasatospora sp. MAA4]
MTATTRTLERIVATTDVHSNLAQITGMLAQLHAERRRSLVVDCGDFFEGTGFYQLAGGSIERQILLSLYDVIAPGNHGWSHHFEPGLRKLTVCANAVDQATGRELFRPLHMAEIGGRQVAVTAVISPQAFGAIPLDQRAGHHVTNPVRALRELLLAHHHEVDAWILLSHSGFEEDLKLADACPFLDVVFAGHCHSEHYGPEPVGKTLVVKGTELGAGYALAEPVGADWTAHPCRFPHTATLPRDLKAIGEEIETISARLNAPLGQVAERWRHTVPDRRELLETVAVRLHSGLGAESVILNETALRPVQLGEVLHLAELLAIEPFGNQLVHADLPEAISGDLAGLLASLTDRAGPLVVTPPLPPGIRSVLTTDYLAETFRAGRARQAGLQLGQAVRHVLTEPQPDPVDGEAE